MRLKTKRIVTYLTIVAIGAATVSIGPKSPYVLTSEAHQGRTDSRGGHKDNKNKSGLGSYHYHCGGYSAHLHDNGICPYQEVGQVSGNTVQETKEEFVPGWRQDHRGWWYESAENTYYTNTWAMIDGKQYCFNPDGYIRIGWYQQEDKWYYFDGNGNPVTGDQQIEDQHYCFLEDGTLVDH